MIQTTTLKTSKLLKAAGFPKDSILFWAKIYVKWAVVSKSDVISWGFQETVKDWLEESQREIFSAPTTDELLAELPDFITQDGVCSVLIIGKPNNIYKVGYRPFGRIVLEFQNKLLCESLALMWLHLKKENLI